MNLGFTFVASTRRGAVERSCRLVSLLMGLAVFWVPTAVNGQSPSGRLVGTVIDITGAAIPGAEIKVRADATNAEFKTSSNEEGYFIVPSIPTGVYTVSASAQGFKLTHVRNVKVDAGAPTSLTIKLEAGSIVEQVTVSGGADLINKTSQTVGATIVGRQITELPLPSRDALDLALIQPGVATPGRPRTSSINGLPKGAINITIDGINVQDNFLRSSDGFFTYIRPRIDAIEEFSISTSNPGAEALGDGAVQISFVTKAGTNEFHGGAWWYHRNSALNSGYYFNSLSGVQKPFLLLNQIGGRLGGPILKNRLFFFGSYDEYRLPSSFFTTRTILTQNALRGIYTYRRTDNQQLEQVNLLQLAARNGFPGTVDPPIQAIIDKLNAGRGQASRFAVNPNADGLAFNVPTRDRRSFPTVRFDMNITERLHWEGVFNYQYFNAFPDTLNNRQPSFPGFVTAGGQKSNRFSISTALRSAITPRLTNEFRFGLQGGTAAFATEVGAADFPLGLRPIFGLMSEPFNNLPGSRRNTPVKTFIDNVSWLKGSHSFTFGGSTSLINSWVSSFGTFGGNVVASVFFGVRNTDPANEVFNPINFPGIDANNDLPIAGALYGLLVGRVTSLQGGIAVNERTRRYELGIPLVERNSQREFGFYGQDSWRARANLTVNLGLRWEYQGRLSNNNNIYSQTGIDGVYGVSGRGNIFRPGVLTGRPTVYIPLKDPAYDRDLNNFAPSIGLAWSPNFKNRILQKIFGSEGKSVFRGGYAIAYIREGMFTITTMLGANPGPFATATLDADREFPAGSVTFSRGLPQPTTSPSAFAFPFRQADFSFGTGLSPNAFDPGLRTAYVSQWSFGIQRELWRNSVIEFRYVGNHGTKLWRQVDLNEINIFENGFLREFFNARNNLEISRRMNRGANFRNQNLPGQVPLPIFEAAFGSRLTDFRAAQFVSFLDTGQAGALATALATNRSRYESLVRAGFPVNFWLVNPESSDAGSFLILNGADSSYHALQIDFRQRLSKGLLMQANYAWSKSLSSLFAVNASLFQDYRTIRAPGLNKGLSPFDINHAFKTNWIYELPFGPGKRWTTGFGPINKVIEGWEFHGIARIQSGRPFLLTSGRATVNEKDAGVVLRGGLTRRELENMIEVRKTTLPDGTGAVFYLPANLIGADGRANTQFIASPTTPGEFGSYIYLHGPGFVRFDLSAVKKTRITEKLNVEFRGEFLNAFNHQNFLVGGGAEASTAATSINSQTFGRVFSAYQDTSTTNDPGGRIIQFVFRINF